MRSIVAILILSSGASAAEDFDSLVKDGRKSFLAYDLDAAQSAYARACPGETMAQFPLPKTALCEHLLGTVAEARDRLDEAEARYVRSLASFEKLGRPYVAHTVTTLTNLGAFYRRERRLIDAEKMLSRGLELAQSLAESNPELYATALSRAGALYGDLNQRDRARQMLDEATARFRALRRPNAPELAYALSARGLLDVASGGYRSAEANFREAMALATEKLGETNPATAAYGTNLALALLMKHEYARAETLLRRARFVIENRLGPDSIQLVNTLTELTSVETALGKFLTAEECGEKALAILKNHFPDGSVEIAVTRVELGSLYLREHDISEAEKILPAAVETERLFLKDGRILGDGIRDLAELRAQQRVWTDAESLYRQAIALYERSIGANHPDIAPVLRAYADVLKHEGAPGGQVKNVEARARAIEKAASHPQG